MISRPQNLPKTILSNNAELVLSKRYYHKDNDGKIIETATDLFWRVASAIAKEEKKYPKSSWKAQALAERFYEIMSNGYFLPNSPTLMNAGSPLGQLSACFVLPVGDSIEEIFDAIKYAAMIHKSGGGTGFSFSNIRSKDSRVGTTGGVASGPVSFLRIFNTATEQIKQGGTRRGANMGILRIDHPDILDFIKAKEQEGEFINFNLSVALTEKFMESVEKAEDYNLIDPHSGAIKGSLNAKEVFDLLVNKAWISGDPGIIFLDRINRDNPTPNQGTMESTNPCGEQPLLPFEACNLGSINLSKFVLNNHSEEKIDSINWNLLKDVIHSAIRFLDNVIDASKFPLDKIADKVRMNRKIGLGVMGFADMLFALEIAYDSEEAQKLAEKIMEFIQTEGRNASNILAEERGSFPAFGESIYKEGKPLRNATITTIAPTGTLSIIAGCSSGVEPIFALAFARNVMDGDRLVEINPYFEQALKNANLYNEEIMEAITNIGSIANFDFLPDHLREIYVTAMDISAEAHLRMQAAFQKYTDNAVSKTVNLPNNATIQDIDHIYKLAYTLGCKGVTVYRDGSKSGQVLTTGEKNKEDANQTTSSISSVVRQRPEIVNGFTQKVKTGLGVLYLTVNEIEGQPFEVFTTIGKSGRSITAKAEAIGRLVSLCFRSGVPVRDVVQQLKGIGGEHPVFQKKGILLSIPDAIAWVLENRYLKGEAPVLATKDQDLQNPACPECGSEMTFQEGCHICQNCGYSRCG